MHFSEQRSAAAAVMAAATLELFPGVLLVEGGHTPVGFYYDFLFPFSLEDSHLPLIEQHMLALAKERRPIKTFEMVPVSAAALFRHRSQTIKAESAADSLEPLLSLIEMGDFIDTCHTQNLSHTGEIGAFRILNAEVKGKENGQTLVRLSGTAFPEKTDLKLFLKKLQRYPQKNHQRIGENLDLFSQDQEGNVVWHPKGERLRQRLIQFWQEEHRKQNFEFVATPPTQTLMDAHLAYVSRLDLAPPIRLAECRYEPVSTSSSVDVERGLFLSNGYFADRAHVFCSSANLLEEVISSLQFILQIPKIFGLSFELVLCPFGKGKPNWIKKRVEVLTQAVHHCQVPYVVGQVEGLQEQLGPSLFLRSEDALGCKWVGPWLALSPARQDMELLVRSSFYSLERFVALLLEQELFQWDGFKS